MKKRFLIESVFMSALLTLSVVLAIGPVAASYPGDDYDYDYDYGYYDSYTFSLAGGEYGGSGYNYGYFYSLRNKGTAEFNGYLWFWWTIDGEEIEWYNPGTYEYQEGSLDATSISVLSHSWFYKGAVQWPCWAYAAIST